MDELNPKYLAELCVELAPKEKSEWSNADIIAEAYLDLLNRQGVLVPMDLLEEITFRAYFSIS